MATLAAAAAAASAAARRTTLQFQGRGVAAALLVRPRPGGDAVVAAAAGAGASIASIRDYHHGSNAAAAAAAAAGGDDDPTTTTMTRRRGEGKQQQQQQRASTHHPRYWRGGTPTTADNYCWWNDDGTIMRRAFFSTTGQTTTTTTTLESPPASPSEEGASSGGESNAGGGGPSSSPPRLRRDREADGGGGGDLLLLPPLTESEYDPRSALERIRRASRFNQGRAQGDANLRNDGRYDLHRRRWQARKWDYEGVRMAADDYERHLGYVLDRLSSSGEGGAIIGAAAGGKGTGTPADAESAVVVDPLDGIHPLPDRCAATHDLLSPRNLSHAVRALTRSRMDTPLLSRRIRDVERLVGSIGRTPITDEFSYRLLEANGKAGNVRRTLALLELRRRRGYPPRPTPGEIEWIARAESKQRREHGGGDGKAEGVPSSDDDDDASNGRSSKKKDDPFALLPGEREFAHGITSIQSAHLPLRRSRNVHLHESSLDEGSLDNPTRYLDAILINMSTRGVPLRPAMANRMLACYASSGRTGRAVHYFYRVARDPIEDDGYYIPGPHPTNLDREGYEEWKREKRRTGAGRVVVSGLEGREEEEDAVSVLDDDGGDDGSILTETVDDTNERTKVRMTMHPPPPFHKVPSEVRASTFSLEGSRISTSASSRRDAAVRGPHDDDEKVDKTRYDWELEREWSPALTAAFAFADSLAHGACGHDPIELDVTGWNCLIKACTHRGALHRAMRILDETMPARGVIPDSYSYNTVLAALARVGDVSSLREVLTDMTNDPNVKVDKYTVQAMADGLLNAGDVSGASTVVQDVFNQHDALPPYTTHLKIIEHALANGLVFEAKRHVYFVQQLWKWEPSRHHDEGFARVVMHTKRNPKLSRRALQRLFRHFHEELEDGDFF